MSPAEILPGLLIVPAIIIGGLIIAIIAKLFWLRVVAPKAEEMARLRKGAEGEIRVADALSVFTEADGYRLLGGLWLPNGRGGLAQIDLVLFSPYGIFVIEVKNYSGKIYIDPSDRVWTQYLGESETPIRSPRKQNYGHVAVLQELTGLPKERFHSIVVLAGNAVIKTAVPHDVVYLHELCERIHSHKEKVLPGEYVNNAIAVVKEKRITDPEEIREYLARMREGRG